MAFSLTNRGVRYNIVSTHEEIIMRAQKIFKAGNSNVVSIPTDVLEKAGLANGSKVVTELAVDGKTILISEAGSKTKASSITPEFVKTLEGVNKRYGSALKKLANL